MPPRPSPALARLHDLRVVRPRFESTQEASFSWLAAAHAEATRRGEADARTPHELTRLLSRFGCGPTKIARRGHELEDFLHTRWEAMQIYDLTRGPEGRDVRARSAAHMEAASRALGRFYDDGAEPPDDLVHVTCTGYASPSAAQRLVAARGWGAHTRVLHAYHMGCYAAVPAMRIAAGLVLSRSARSRVDVVHNEVCSLHLHPGDATPEQLVVQSLFADGHAHYALSNEPTSGPGFDVLSVHEAIAPESADSMTWNVGPYGMAMTLARDVPARIGGALRGFVDALYAQAGVVPEPGYAGDVFAVHPGGPRIIDAVASALELDDTQVAASRSVLLRFGNMSSATLPHVWKDIAEDPSVPSGTRVLSLAFGPGLTLAGALLRKA